MTTIIKEASPALERKGNLQKVNVREKAAQTLAENLNNYFSNNGTSHNYDEIRVNFEDDNRRSQPKYIFNNGFCGPDNCKLEFEYAEGKTIVIE